MLSKENLNRLTDALSTEIESQRTEKEIAGMAAALVSREGVLWAEGFGHTDQSLKQPATPDSLFNLQSSGKMVNAVAFLRMVQHGVVDLDMLLIEAYPEFRIHDRIDDQQYRRITFRHLLSHFAGLTHESPLGGNWDNRDLPHEEIIASINGTWMIGPPGVEHRYSNCGMNLMLAGLQRLAGIPVPEMVHQEVIKPLGMDSMTFGKPAAQKHPEYVTGYDGGIETLFESFSDLGAGCQYCSVRDFARFVQMRLNQGTVNGQTYLDPELLAEARTPQFSGPFRYSQAGLGLFIYSNILPGELVYGHAGGGCGYSGEVLWSLEHGIGIIIEANDEFAGFATVQALARKALQMAVEAEGVTLPAIQPPQITDQEPHPLNLSDVEDLTGDYMHYGTSIEVRIKEEELIYRLHGDEHCLTYHGDLVFTADYPPCLRFFRDKDGHPDHLMWLNGQGEFVKFHYDHISNSKPDGNPADLDQYTGLYQGKVYGFRPYGAIRRAGNHLEARFFLFDGKLEQERPGLFFTPDGECIRIEGNKAWFGNRPTIRVEDPVGDLKLALETEPDNYILHEYNLRESLVPMLEFLDRSEEAAEVRQIADQLYPKGEATS